MTTNSSSIDDLTTAIMEVERTGTKSPTANLLETTVDTGKHIPTVGTLSYPFKHF